MTANLGSILNIGVQLSPSNITLLYEFAHMYAPPISTGESRITGLGIRGMVEQLLNCSLCKGGMALGAGGVSQIFCEAGPVADWAIIAAGTGCAVSRRRIRGYGVVSHLRIEFGGLVVPAKGDD
jgi:hypothetical protein